MDRFSIKTFLSVLFLSTFYFCFGTEIKVSTSVPDGSDPDGQDYEDYAEWTIPGSGTVSLTKIHWYDYNGSLSGSESIEMAIYESIGSKDRLSEIVTGTGSGSIGWVDGVLSTPINITLGTTYIFGSGPSGSATYATGFDVEANDTNYLPNEGSFFVAVSGGLDATVPTGMQALDKYGIWGITYSDNSVPTNITLSSSSVNENQATATTVGALTTTDADVGDSHTYTLVSGTGDTDNGKFQIATANLQTQEKFDYERKSSYSVRIETDDGNGGTYEKAFTITITDINDAPVAGSGNCLYFDGTDDVVTITGYKGITGTSSRTCEAWIKATSTIANKVIISWGTTTPGDKWVFRTQDDNGTANTLRVEVNSGHVVGSINVLDNEWHHVACVLTDDGSPNADEVKLYVDGQEETLSSILGENITTASGDDVRIGNGHFDKFFDGYIDEVRIWSTARTEAQIRDNMYTALVGNETGLVAYYRLDESQGDYASDEVGSNHGDLESSMTDGDWVASEAWKNRSLHDTGYVEIPVGYDEDGDALTITESVSPSNGTQVEDSAAVQVFYVSDINHNSTDNFTYQISDGTLTDTYAMIATVTNYNLAPVAGAGNCLKFDGFSGLGGSNEYVMVPYSASLAPTSAVSVEAMVYYADWNIGLDEAFVSKMETGGYSIGISDDGDDSLYACAYRNGAYGSATYPLSNISGGFHHVAMTFDGRYVKLYLDGALVATDDAGSSYPITYSYSNALIIGAEAGTGTTSSMWFSTAYIDEVRVWDDVRTVSEIDDNRYTALVGSESNLVGYWRMDKSNGIACRDYSGDDNHGILRNMEDADWKASTIWKNRATDDQTALTHSGGYDFDGNSVTLSTSVAPSQGTLSYDSPNRNVTYTPTASQLGTFTYTYQISDGARLSNTYEMSMVVTNINPYVSTYVPTDGATGVSTTSNLVLTFNKAVDAETGDIVLYKTSGDVVIQTFDVTTDISGSGTTIIILNPASNLDVSTDYYIKIDATAFDDVSSNSYAGISDETTWNFTTSATGPEDYVDWSYSKNLYINTTSSGADVSGDVQNFPLLIRLTSSDFTFSEALSTGFDIRFAKSDGTHLKYERERWDDTNDLAEFWVLCDMIYGDNSTQYIKMYWGKTGASDSSSASDVFGTASGYDFSGVWHLAEDGGSSGDDYKDATSNAYHGTGSSMTTSSDLDGVIGRAQDFAGDLDYIDLPDLGTKSDVTVSCWFKYETTGSNEGLVSAGSWTTGIVHYKIHDNVIRAGTLDGEDAVSPTSLSSVTWYHSAYTYTNNGAVILYVDGIPKDTALVPADDWIGSTMEIGHENNIYASGNRYFDGIIDEVCISAIVRSPDWIKLCYETQKLGATIVEEENVQLLPLTMKDNVGTGTSDTILVYTDNWSIVFDEDNGGTIKWLSDSSEMKGTNQLYSNMFTVYFSNYVNTRTGVLSIIESNSLFAKIKNIVTISGVTFTLFHTIYGDGRMFIVVDAENRSGSNVVNEIRFGVTRSYIDVGNLLTETTTASTTSFGLLADRRTGQFDLLFSLYELWNEATKLTKYYNSDNGYARVMIINLAHTFANNTKQSWRFMVNFAHKNWNDTTDVVKAYAREYQSPDSLSLTYGTYRMKKAWEDNLGGHWNFDDATSGSADEDSAYDVAGANNAHVAKIQGGTWTSGRWGDGALTLAVADSLEIKTSSDFNNQPIFTIMAWIKKSGTTETDALIFGDDNASASGYRLVSNSDKLELVFSTTTVTGNTALGTNWRFVAATANNNNGWIKLYVDGKVDTTYLSDLSTIFSPGSNAVSIGNSFAGDIDDVRFYGKELSEETIFAIYNNSYRAGQGMYSLRCDNNSSIDFEITGSSELPINNPVFELANYWGTAKPKAVYFDNQWQTENTDFIAYLNDVKNMLYIGFKKTVTSLKRIYIDDVDSTGAYKVGPTKKMTYGTSGSDYYVKNTSSTSFGVSGSNEFYFLWKMSKMADGGKGGEVYEFKSSNKSPSTLISSATNQFDVATYREKTSLLLTQLNGTTGWIYATYATATPTYTILESSSTRVRLRLDSRTIHNTTLNGIEWDIVSYFTIYPTGQIFRLDSCTSLTEILRDEVFTVRLLPDASANFYKSNDPVHASCMSGSVWQDMSVALLSSTEKNGDSLFQNLPFNTNNASKYFTIEFTETGNDRPASDGPFVYVTYADIQRDGMDSLYMDSVCKSVQNIQALTMTTGTRVTNSLGDLKGDGFNEAEGAYVIQADNNSANFEIQADGATDGCKFYPAFRFTNYSSSNLPKYVRLYNGSDTIMMVEGYGYNGYVNTTTHELIIQLDTVLCADAKIYLSCDDDLAVTMSEFKAKGGDGNDTLFWRTESESENLGFYLYRRIDPEFLDSLSKATDSTASDSSLDDIAILFRKKSISHADTVWNKVNKTIIPGAEGGTSHGPCDYKYIDNNVINFIKYEYKIHSIDYQNSRSIYGPIAVTPHPIFPGVFFLFHNYPNPVKRYTNIRFDLPTKTKVSLNVYNLKGRLIASIIKPHKKQKAGFYNIRWHCNDDSGRKIASGPYIYRLVAGKKYAKSRLMLLVK